MNQQVITIPVAAQGWWQNFGWLTRVIWSTFAYGAVWYGFWDGPCINVRDMVCNVMCPLLGGCGIVPGMVLASAGGTGPIFPGATVPPDGNVANPTRPGIRLPCSVTQNKKKQIPPWCPGTRPGIRLDQPSTATPKFEGKCRLILARYMAWTN